MPVLPIQLQTRGNPIRPDPFMLASLGFFAFVLGVATLAKYVSWRRCTPYKYFCDTKSYHAERTNCCENIMNDAICNVGWHIMAPVIWPTISVLCRQCTCIGDREDLGG